MVILCGLLLLVVDGNVCLSLVMIVVVGWPTFGCCWLRLVMAGCRLVLVAGGCWLVVFAVVDG